jgi:hypothetical protein
MIIVEGVRYYSARSRFEQCRSGSERWGVLFYAFMCDIYRTHTSYVEGLAVLALSICSAALWLGRVDWADWRQRLATFDDGGGLASCEKARIFVSLVQHYPPLAGQHASFATGNMPQTDAEGVQGYSDNALLDILRGSPQQTR